MRVYLSGPMSGIPDYNAPAFVEAAKQLRALGHHVASPLEIDIANGVDFNNVPPWGSLLARDVKLIADSGIEAIAVLPGWELSRGARLEVTLGLILNLPTLTTRGNTIPRHVVVEALAESFS